MRSVHLSKALLRQSTRVALGNARPRCRTPLHAPLSIRRCSSHITKAKKEPLTAEMIALLDPTAPALLTAEDILGILPHRYPFLLVDRVTHLEEEKMIVGYKNITMNDNFFTGHFPDRPIMPGVLQIEAMAQLAGVLILRGLDETAKDNFLFGGVDNCRWRKPVVPGDTLMMKVDIKKFNLRFGIVKAHGECFVNGETVCDTDLTLVVAK